ncbi:MAG: protease inhibitor I42 family protein [Proteobacteria bacterium]|nr:protease inhibitor I42 family protein [Pseudomonadota bacterium]
MNAARRVAPALALAMLVAGCSSLQPQAPRVVDAAASGTTVTLGKGDTLVVTLANDRGNDYRWVVDGPRDATLKGVGTLDRLPQQVAPGTVGHAGDSVYRFQAREAGHATLDLALRKLYDPAAAPAQTVHYDVNVVDRPGPVMAAWSGKP